MPKAPRFLVPILLACHCGGPASTTPAADTRLELIKQEELTLEDPDVPVQYLEQLTTLPDGGFVAVDIVANKVRRFDPSGKFLGYVGPPEAEPDDWRPRTSGIGSDPTILWIGDKLGRLWRFERLGLGAATQYAVHRYLPHFVIDPSDNIVGRMSSDQGELHLFSGGYLSKSFLESDRFNLSLTAKSSPSVTFGEEGNIYAIRFLDPTVVVFDPRGEELRRWPLRRDPHFREFPLGIDPYSSTRERNLILAWHRTFTTFPRIEWVAGGRVAVLSANDPPQRPNVITLYTPEGTPLAAAEVQGYLVAARGRDLYLANEFYFYQGPCRVTRYSLPD